MPTFRIPRKHLIPARLYRLGGLFLLLIILVIAGVFGAGHDALLS